MKKSTKFLPVIGWSMWFSEYVFLSRNWSKDEKVLKVWITAVNFYFVPIRGFLNYYLGSVRV